VMGVMERQLRANAQASSTSPNVPSHTIPYSQGQVVGTKTKTPGPQSSSKTGTLTMLPSVGQGSSSSSAFNGALAKISDSGPELEQRVCIDLTTEPAMLATIHVPDMKNKASASLAKQDSRRQQHASMEAKPESLESAMTNLVTLKLSCRTLPEFYSMLDKIERTSYVGARYLEAYAEYLQNTDSCSNCWFEKRMMPEEELGKLEDEIRKEMGEE